MWCVGYGPQVFSSGSAQDKKHGGYPGYDAQYAFTPECTTTGRVTGSHYCN